MDNLPTILGCRIETDLSLPWAPTGSATQKARIHRAALPETAGFSWRHDWQDGTGVTEIAYQRIKDTHYLRFPAYCDVRVTFAADINIEYQPEPGVSTRTLVHLLFDQVLPRALSHQGLLVLHGSAVQRQGAAAIGFIAASGTGKSTLAAYLCQGGGYALVADDCLVLEGEHAPGVRRAPPANRLNPDSQQQLDLGHLGNVSTLNEKLMTPAPPAATVATLERLYLLSAGDRPALRPGHPATRLIEITRQAFRLDLTDRDASARQFDQVARLVASVEVLELVVPHDYAALAEVRALIERC